MRHARPFFIWTGSKFIWSGSKRSATPLWMVLGTLIQSAVATLLAGALQVCGSSRKNTLLESLSSDGGYEAVALVIYTKPGCPYCQQARDYYNSKGITFIDRDAQTNKEFRAQMFKFSGGDPTVPCIVKDGKYVQSGWGDPLRG